jgi:hypothetical protein
MAHLTRALRGAHGKITRGELLNWFNPAAFAVPANGTWSNLGRYAARGPGYYEIDGAFEKSFRLVVNSSSGSFGGITSILNTGATGTGTPAFNLRYVWIFNHKEDC